MNKLFQKYIFLCFCIFSIAILIGMDAGMPENDEEKQIEYLKEHPQKIDEILAKKKWYHNCCAPSREISLAEQAREELRLDQKIIQGFDTQKLNIHIQKFKPYEFKWLSKSQIQSINSGNFTLPIINLLNLEMMNNITSTQFAGFKADQVKNLIDRYQSLIHVDDPLQNQKTIAFINKFEKNTQSESVINQLSTIKTELLYNRIKNNQASSQELTSLTDRQAIDLVNYYQSKMHATHEQNYNQLLNFLHILEENNKSEQVINTINHIKTKLLYNRIKNNQASTQELANLRLNQITDLVAYYQNEMKDSHDQNYEDFLSFINKIEEETRSKAIRSEINTLKVASIYSDLTDNDIANSQVFTKDSLTTIISKLENFDLDYLMKHSKSKMLEKITKKQLNNNFSKDITRFPAEYMKYINISNLEPFDINYLEKDQIKALSEEQIKKLEEIQLETLSSVQIQALTEKQIQALSSDQLKILYDNHSLSYFTKEQIGALTLNQIKNLKIPLLSKLHPSQIQFFRPEQVQNFNPSWFKELTFDQFNYLTEEQLKLCNKLQIESILERIKQLLSLTRNINFSKDFKETQNILQKIIKSHQSSLEIIELINNFYLLYYATLDNQKITKLSNEAQKSITQFINNINITQLTFLISNSLSNQVFDTATSNFIEKLLDPNYYNEIAELERKEILQHFFVSLNQNSFKENQLFLLFQKYFLQKFNDLSIDSLFNISILYTALDKTFIKYVKDKRSSIQKSLIENMKTAFTDKFEVMNQTELSNFIKKSKHRLSSLAYDVYQSRFKKTALK